LQRKYFWHSSVLTNARRSKRKTKKEMYLAKQYQFKVGVREQTGLVAASGKGKVETLSH